MYMMQFGKSIGGATQPVDDSSLPQTTDSASSGASNSLDLDLAHDSMLLQELMRVNVGVDDESYDGITMSARRFSSFVDGKAVYSFPWRLSSARCCAIEQRKYALTWQPTQQVVTKVRRRYNKDSAATSGFASQFSSQQISMSAANKDGSNKGLRVYKYSINDSDSPKDGNQEEENEETSGNNIVLLSTIISPIMFNQIESAFLNKMEKVKESESENATTMETDDPASEVHYRHVLPNLEGPDDNKTDVQSTPASTIDDDDDIFADAGVNYGTEVKKELLIKPIANSTTTHPASSSIYPVSLLKNGQKSLTSAVHEDDELGLLTKRAMQSLVPQYGEEDDGRNGNTEMDYYLDEEEGDIISTRISQSSHRSSFEDGKSENAAKRQELNKRKVKETNKWNQVNKLLEKDQYQKIDKLEQQISDKRFKSTGNYLGIR